MFKYGSILVLVLFSNSVMAVNKYIKVEYGSQSVSDKSEQINFGTIGSGQRYNVTESEVDSSGGGFKIGIGYEFGKSYGLEFYLFNMGEYSLKTIESYSNDGTDTNVHTVTQTFDSIGLGLSNLVFLDIDQNLELYGKFGALFVLNDNTYSQNFVSDTQQSFDFSKSDSANHISIELGAGVKYNFTKKISMYLDYSFYNKAAPDIELSLTSLGLNYSF